MMNKATSLLCRYKAHFRWKHYTEELHEGVEKPLGTEACASVTSAFLQILNFVHSAEASRVKNSRNVLQILSLNTRRTKVVELSTGTHRVADDVRRHCLADGEGGHYSTNLDRNRYGSDNNYLFTVTRYNLECLGLCPCLVDIEIIDTRNGNESQLVTAGSSACTCDSAERRELADTVNFSQIVNAQKAVPPSPPREIRRISSATNMNGMRRVSSATALRRNPSSNRLYDGHHPTHSRNSGGSDLFDALLMAATGEHDGAVVEANAGAGEAPVTSRHARPHRVPSHPGGNLHGAGSLSKLWAQHSFGNEGNDSMQNVMEALQKANADPESLARLGSKGMPRRNSVSMIVENPVLAQTGGGESLMMGTYFPMMMGSTMDGELQSAHEPREGAGDTDHGKVDGEDPVATAAGGGESEDGQVAAFRGLMKQFNNSAVNLNRLAASAGPAEVRRLQEEIRQLREENKAKEVALEEVRSARLDALREAEEAREASRRAADTIQRLRNLLASGGITDLDALDEHHEGLRTSEQEIKLLKDEINDLKSKLADAVAEKKDMEGKLAKLAPPSPGVVGPGQAHQQTQDQGGKSGWKGSAGMANTNAAVAAAAAMQMPLAAMSMLPLFGLPQLASALPAAGPLPTSSPNALNLFRPPIGNGMSKVASMPSMGLHSNVAGGGLPPPKPFTRDKSDVNLKRKGDKSGIGSDDAEQVGRDAGHKRAAIAGSDGKPHTESGPEDERPDGSNRSHGEHNPHHHSKNCACIVKTERCEQILEACEDDNALPSNKMAPHVKSEPPEKLHNEAIA